MEDVREKRRRIVSEIEKKISARSEAELKEMRRQAVDRLFEFANYVEARIALLYLPRNPMEMDIADIMARSYERKKVVVLPRFDKERKTIRFYKVDDPDTHIIGKTPEDRGPDPKKCREIPMDNIDIALIPGVAFDEKGSRIAADGGEFDRLMGKLPVTTRKVGVTLEDQIVPQIPMESKSRYVDILVTDKRVIYKI
ncbi:5-formyltetrahydrofolate cyclo-ligase [Desulfobotulus alkaliphilus]|uniref:5-formyltetrahydrofolate cyclo-ligase n=1 Tax=Desulfobotulus alkaliphilus TaxID=622671 RepID=A0A562RAG4_9BACT|nr:5-formyltetrahydrofolate cyclo-ligase [Desulfobotulus alkaliphilus]TWI66061.1 5-formyltetrahydrofolate cyclo-ligase [Desulfobotulus alkaliphilus]